MTAEKRKDSSSWLSEGGEKVSKTTLLKIYEAHEKQFRAHLDLHYKNRNYYMTLVSALLSIFVGGMLQFYKEKLSFILFVIPISIVVLSELAKRTMDRYYLSFLESVVILAKIEHVLGLSGSLKIQKSESLEDLWPKDKQFILDRWKERYDYESSQQFVNARMKMGDNRYAHWVFTILEIITIFLAVLSFWIFIQIHWSSILDWFACPS